MQRITTIDFETASGKIKELLDTVQTSLGVTSNIV